MPASVGPPPAPPPPPSLLLRPLPAPAALPGRAGRLPSTYSHPIYGPDAVDAPPDGRFSKLAAAGGLAGALSRTATAPLDRLRVLLSLGGSGTRTRYGARQAWASMQAEGTVKVSGGGGGGREGSARGARALSHPRPSSLPSQAYFRGNGVNVIKNVPETALKLAANDAGQRALVADGHRLRVGERLAVGAAAGAVAQVAIYPLEVIQTRLAATAGAYRGIGHCVTAIWRTEGARAFGRGLTPTLAGILPYAGVDIAAFELLKERLTGGTDAPLGAAALLGAGVASSAAAQLVAYPLGLVRTRLQMDGMNGAPRTYAGPADCARQVAAREGWAGLYKGFGANLAKVAPAASISWFVFEHAKGALACPDVAKLKMNGGGGGDGEG